VPSLTIRKLDEQTKARLRVRAAHHQRSMEDEARARCNGAVIATRIVADFEGCGVKVINPWSA
jgi:plasmid stability protein